MTTYNDLTEAQQNEWDEIAASNEWWDGIDEYAEMAFESFVRSLDIVETPDRDDEFTALEDAALADLADIREDLFGVKCRRCAGTGQFITYVENGVPKGPGGICFRCNGNGLISEADRRRNYGYDNYAIRVAM
jgi:hypothetical protein